MNNIKKLITMLTITTIESIAHLVRDIFTPSKITVFIGIVYTTGFLKYSLLLQHLNISSVISVPEVYSQWDILSAGISFFVVPLSISITYTLLLYIYERYNNCYKEKESDSQNIHHIVFSIICFVLFITYSALVIFLGISFNNSKPLYIITALIICFYSFYIIVKHIYNLEKQLKIIPPKYVFIILTTLFSLPYCLYIASNYSNNIKSNISYASINQDKGVYGTVYLNNKNKEKMDGLLLNIKDNNYYFILQDYNVKDNRLYIISSDNINYFETSKQK